MSRKVLVIDNEYYGWKNDSITGADLLSLANVPDGFQIFQEMDGQDNKEIKPAMTVSLVDPGIERFSTKKVDS